MDFNLDDVEIDNLNRWCSSHKCLKDNIMHFERFSFINNGIGTSVSVKCTKCKTKQDITNLESW